MHNYVLLFMTLMYVSSLPAFCVGQHDRCGRIQAELLYWSIGKTDRAIPLVTSASLADNLPGALNQPGTQVVLSSCAVSLQHHLGFSFTGDLFVDVCKCIDLEMSYVLLPQQRIQRSLTTSGQPGSPNFAVPVFDTTGVWGLNGIPGETIAVLPGPLTPEPGFYGQFDLSGTTQFQNAELLLLHRLSESPRLALACSGGFGWMQFKESLIFSGKTHTVANATIPFDFFNFTDCFATKNNFFGLLCGLRAECMCTAWKFRMILNGGIGLMRNDRTVNGSSQTAAGNLFFLTAHTADQELDGGIFTQPSNIGRCRKYRLGGTVEATVRVGIMIRNRIELFLGYNLIALTSVARAADQICRNINSTRTSLAQASRETVGIGPGPIPFGMPAAAPIASGDTSPQSLFATKNFLTQGLIAGFMISF